MKPRILITLFALWGFSLCYLGYATTPEFLKNAQLIKIGQEVSTDRYPNADQVCIDDYTQTEYQKNGAYEQINDSCTKVLTEVGKRGNTSLSRSYDISYGTTMFLRVEIIKPDGKIVPVAIDENCKNMVDRSQMAANIFNPNSKVMSVNVPGLEIGDMIRSTVVSKQTKARMPNTFSDYLVFEYTMPILNTTAEYIGPKDMPLVTIALKSEIKGTVSKSFKEVGDKNVYKWVVKDVPQAYPEPKMPKMYTVVQRLLVSTIPDWQTVSKWYAQLCEAPLSDTNAAMIAKVAELTKDCQTDQKKIKAIFHFVSQKIRYMGITTEDTAPGYEPHNVSMTFNNKYGVCRDKAALLATMLRLAGFKAYPVLIFAGPKKDKEVPQPFFNHAITSVEKDNGDYILMDSTDENTKELFPSYLCDRSYIVAKSAGDDLRVSEIIPAEENMLLIDTKASMDKSGKLSATTVLDFNGINDNAYRGYFSTIKGDDLKKFFERVVNGIVNGAELKSYSIIPENMMDVSTNLIVKLNYIAKNVPVSNGDIMTIEPLWFGTKLGVVNFVLGATGLEKRKYPYALELACGVKDQFSLDLSEAVEDVEFLPTFDKIDNNSMLWIQSLEFTNSVLLGKNEKKLRTVELSPAEYLAIKQDLKDIEYESRKIPIFLLPLSFDEEVADTEAAKYPNSDIVTLLKETTVRFVNEFGFERDVTIRKKILTYAGKKDNAEININYNPVWDKVDIAYARVIGTDGTVKSVTDKEINIMDSGWVSSAPRYSAGKTMVINLPDVDVGSIIEYKILYKHKKRSILSFTECFMGYDPVEKYNIRIETPKKIDLKIADYASPKVKVRKTKSGKTNVYEWTSSSLEVLHKANLLPPSWYYLPGFVASDGDWEEYAELLDDMLGKYTKRQKATKAKAKELTKGSENDREKIIAIRDFVAKNIRLAGPGFNSLPLCALSKTDVTLADGYGNQADRGMLLLAMLEAAGIDAEYILASSMPICKRLKSPTLKAPTVGTFSAFLVKAKCDDKWVILNDSDQYSRLGTSAYDKRQALDIDQEEIVTIKVDKFLEDQNKEHYNVKIANDGSAEITKTIFYFGTSFSSFQRKYAEMTPEDRRRNFLEMVAGISQSAVAIGDLVTEYKAYPGKLRFKVKVDRYAVANGENMHFNLPGASANMLGLTQDKRQYPIYLSRDTKATISYQVDLPPAYPEVLLAPGDIDWQLPNQAGRITFLTKSAKGELYINREINIKSSVIPAKQYPHLKEMNSKFSHPSSDLILLTK